ncbi:MAG TPA: HAD family hydrolase [Vicinamibacterales bacterium]|jgi:putative hydrolase of the HAD superfamily
MIRAVLFDVDFTLIEPGPMFRAEGYHSFCARHDMHVDASRFDKAVASAAAVLDSAGELPYDAAIFVAYTRHIIEHMGGAGPNLDACAREIYDEWATCQHFELYDEAPAVLRALATRGLRIGLISNSHRSLESFQSHFELGGLIDATISSPDHGFMKPHPSIFSEALQRLGVQPSEGLMVGDSVREDVEGALGAGMRAALVHRSASPHPRAAELAARGVPIIGSLRELINLV